MVQALASFFVQSSLALPSTTHPLAPAYIAKSEDNHTIASDLSQKMLNHSVHLFKNLNPYWGAATCLAIWFLLWHTPSFWANRRIVQTGDVMLGTHILAAATIYSACAHNCLITPSLHPWAKLSHTWVGRLGLLSGIVSFFLGAFMAWSRLSVDSERVEGSTTLGFAIPITIGGILQIISEIRGFLAIREYKSLTRSLQHNVQLDEDERSVLQQQQYQSLKRHIESMLSLFMLACGIPAGIRLAAYIGGGEDSLLTVFVIILLISAMQAVVGCYVKRMSPPSLNKEDIGANPPTTYHTISD